MKDIFRIKLVDVHFYSRIGVYEQERVLGNDFKLNVEVEIDASIFDSENLSTSISYAEIYEETAKVMKREWLLLESVAKELKKVYLTRWPQILRGRIEIIKRHPPIPGITGSCGIDYIF